MSEYAITPSQRQELRRFEQGIDFNEELCCYMSSVALLGVTSPSATGSTTLIEKTGLPKVPGATTRNQRYEGETGIRFLPHTAIVIDECIDKARAGELVQIKLSGEGRVYFSETVDYQQGRINVVDMNARSIVSLLALPIQQLVPVAIVSPFNEWASRFEATRGPFSAHRDRLWDDLEGLQFTTTFSDADHDLEFVVLVNPQGAVDRTAARLVEVAHGSQLSEAEHTEGGLVRAEMIKGLSSLF